MSGQQSTPTAASTASAIRIVGIGGSLSPNSSSLAGLKVALEGAREVGATIELFDLSSMDLPFYQPRLAEESIPPDVQRLVDATASAQGMIWSSPLYHGSVSAAFKNAIDWLEQLHDHQPAYLTDQAIGLMASSAGAQAMQAINTMEYIVRALRGHTVPYVVPISRSRRAFDSDGKILDEELASRLQLLGQETVRLARRLGR